MFNYIHYRLALETHKKHHKTSGEVKVYNSSLRRVPVGNLRCDLCGFITKNRGLLNTHARAFHHPDLPFECTFCTRRFKTRLNMYGHRIYHRNFQKFIRNPSNENDLPLNGRLRLRERRRKMLKNPRNVTGGKTVLDTSLEYLTHFPDFS